MAYQGKLGVEAEQSGWLFGQNRLNPELVERVRQFVIERYRR